MKFKKTKDAKQETPKEKKEEKPIKSKILNKIFKGKQMPTRKQFAMIAVVFFVSWVILFTFFMSISGSGVSTPDTAGTSTAEDPAQDTTPAVALDGPIPDPTVSPPLSQDNIPEDAALKEFDVVEPEYSETGMPLSPL